MSPLLTAYRRSSRCSVLTQPRRLLLKGKIFTFCQARSLHNGLRLPQRCPSRAFGFTPSKATSTIPLPALLRLPDGRLSPVSIHLLLIESRDGVGVRLGLAFL
jgi:hypothetical protein